MDSWARAYGFLDVLRRPRLYFFNDYKIFYYPSGVKSSEGRIVDGKPEGWWKSYNEKGVLISEGNRKTSSLTVFGLSTTMILP